MENKSWHLSKTLSTSLIIGLIGTMLGGAVAWANTQRDIGDNKHSIEDMEPKVTAIYEGLLSQGIIKPITR